MLFFAKTMMIVAGVIHLLPMPGVLGPAYLSHLYGIPFNEPNVLIMMRHRAVLFGLLGLFLIVAAFRADLFALAMAGGAISAASFIALAWRTGGYNEAIARIVAVDVVALVCLAAAWVCHLLGARMN